MTVALLLASALLLFYTWAGYPALLWLLVRFHRVHRHKAAITPRVSVIVAARNEEKDIRARVENLLSLDYPPEHIEIVIASDGSTDRTAQWVREFADERVKLLAFAEARGRAAVHNDAVAASSGEILVFTDAATRFDRAFLAELVANFADPRVGCVSGEIRFANREASSVTRPRSAYWRYEYWMRNCESACGVSVCASGPCMAVRRGLFRPFARASYDVDFMTPLDVIAQGGLVLQEPAARATDQMFSAPGQEFRAQVRMVSRNLRGYLDRSCLVFLPGRPQFAWALISHKILRWSTPFFLMVLFLSNAWLVGRGGWLALWMAQWAFYAAAAAGGLGLKIRRSASPFSVPYAFCLANAGFLFGVVRSLRGQRITVYGN